MIKKGLNLILKGAISGFCLFCLSLLFYIIISCTIDIIFLFFEKKSNPEFEYYFTLIILPILLRIFYKNINKNFLIITSIFYLLIFYLSMIYTCKSKDIIYFIQNNYKYIILFPSLTVFGYFLPDLISKIPFLNKFKNIKLNFKINPLFLLALQAVGLTYLIWYFLGIFQLAFVNYIKYIKILKYFDVLEISTILSILIVLTIFIKKYKNPLNIYGKLKFSLLCIILGYYLPTIIFYFYPICPCNANNGSIDYFVFTPILILTRVFLYILIFNDILNIKYVIKPHENIQNTNKLRYLFIILGFLGSLIPIYIVNQGIINILPVNILLSLSPLVIIWGLLKLLYREIKIIEPLELLEDRNQVSAE